MPIIKRDPTPRRRDLELLGSHSSKYMIRLSFVLISLFVVFLHKVLPPQRFNLLSDDFSQYMFYTAQIGGKSTAKWIDKSTTHFQCEFHSTSTSEYCGFQFVLAGADSFKTFDLSKYSSIEIDLDYIGSADQLRLGINTYKDGIVKKDGSRLDFPTTYRIREPGLNTQLKAKISHFQMPSWWLDTWLSKLSFTMEQAKPDIGNTFALSIDIPYSSNGITGIHDIKINAFAARGHWIEPETLYFGILALWMLFEGMVSSWQLYQLKQQNREKGEMIDQLSTLNKALENKSLSDPLTGLLNREGFLAQARPLNNAFYCLIMLDLDHFKKVNDSHGHSVGDVVIQRTSEILEQSVRKSDFVGRWGGEEFIILCPAISGKDAKFLAEKIRTLIKQCTPHASIKKPITISIGIAEKLYSNENFSSVLERSDDALYSSKHNGRDIVTLSKHPNTIK